MFKLSLLPPRNAMEKDRIPTRPVYMSRISRAWAGQARVGVIPVVSPTVPRAEAV